MKKVLSANSPEVKQALDALGVNQDFLNGIDIKIRAGGVVELVEYRVASVSEKEQDKE